MKKPIILLLSSALLFGKAYGADKTLATYKGGEVTESQIQEYIKPIFAAQNVQAKNFEDLSKQDQENILKIFVRTKILEAEAKKQGIDSSKEFQEKVEAFKNNLLTQDLVAKQLNNPVDEKEIDKEYDNLTKFLQGTNELKVSHILVATEKEAKDIEEQLKKDAKKFASLAKKYSKDEGTKVKGGNLGYVTKGQLVPEFEKAANDLKTGEISKPVQTQFGWHIIKLDDKRPATIPSKKDATASLTAKIKNGIINEYINSLEEKYSVKITLPNKESK